MLIFLGEQIKFYGRGDWYFKLGTRETLFYLLNSIVLWSPLSLPFTVSRNFNVELIDK